MGIYEDGIRPCEGVQRSWAWARMAIDCVGGYSVGEGDGTHLPFRVTRYACSTLDRDLICVSVWKGQLWPMGGWSEEDGDADEGRERGKGVCVCVIESNE